MNTTDTITALLTRVVGMQTDKARRTAAAATNGLLQQCGLNTELTNDRVIYINGLNAELANAGVVYVGGVSVSFDSSAVVLDSWVLDGPLYLRKDTSPSDIVTAVSGLVLLAQQIVKQTNGEDPDNNDVGDAHGDGEDDVDWDLDLFYVPSDDYQRQTWTLTADIPKCCDELMAEKLPRVLGSMKWLCVERVFHCAACDTDQSREVTDVKEAILLASEVL